MDARTSRELKSDQEQSAMPLPKDILGESFSTDQLNSQEIAARIDVPGSPFILRVCVAGGFNPESIRRAWDRLAREDVRLRTLYQSPSGHRARQDDLENSAAILTWEEHDCRGLTADQFAEWQREFLQTEVARAGRQNKFPLLGFFVLLLDDESQLIWVLEPTLIESEDARLIVERLISRYRELGAVSNELAPPRASATRTPRSQEVLTGLRNSGSWTLNETPAANEWCYRLFADRSMLSANLGEDSGGSNNGAPTPVEKSAYLSAEAEELPHPSTEILHLRAQLLTIWQGVFKKENIGLHDDFFALGGHSLLAAKLLTRIHRALGKELSLASLVDFPTIEGQAQFLGGITTDLDSRGREPSVKSSAESTFILLGADPTFQPLMEELKKHYTVRSIGLSAKLLSGLRHSDTLEQIAARCKDELKKIVPGKRYVLAGWCNHGVLALEMAKQLRNEGVQVPLVVMLQTSNPMALQCYTPWKRFISRTQLDWHLTKFEILYLRHLGIKRGGHYLYNRLTWPGKRGANGRGVPGDSENESQFERDYFDFLHWAAERYQCVGYDAPVVLFRGRQKTYGFASVLDLGWGDLLGKKFEVCEVDGNHFTMFIPPYAKGLAEKMGEYIRKAEREQN